MTHMFGSKGVIALNLIPFCCSISIENGVIQIILKKLGLAVCLISLKNKPYRPTTCHISNKKG